MSDLIATYLDANVGSRRMTSHLRESSDVDERVEKASKLLLPWFGIQVKSREPIFLTAMLRKLRLRDISYIMRILLTEEIADISVNIGEKIELRYLPYSLRRRTGTVEGIEICGKKACMKIAVKILDRKHGGYKIVIGFRRRY